MLFCLVVFPCLQFLRRSLLCSRLVWFWKALVVVLTKQMVSVRNPVFVEGFLVAIGVVVVDSAGVGLVTHTNAGIAVLLAMQVLLAPR